MSLFPREVVDSCCIVDSVDIFQWQSVLWFLGTKGSYTNWTSFLQMSFKMTAKVWICKFENIYGLSGTSESWLGLV